MAIYFYFGISIRTFEVSVIPVVQFLITCLVSGISKIPIIQLFQMFLWISQTRTIYCHIPLSTKNRNSVLKLMIEFQKILIL